MSDKRYKGRDHYKLDPGEIEEFKAFPVQKERFPRNPPRWEHVADPYSGCNSCYSNQVSYGMNYRPYFPPAPEKFTQPKDCESCFSNLPDYGQKFGRTFEKYWRCPQAPNGCVKQRMEGAVGVI